MNAPAELKGLLCEQWCAEVDLAKDDFGWRVALPISHADGDYVTVWISPALGGWHIRDCGTTIMRLSYDMDVDLLLKGTRSKVLRQILDESALVLEDGELVANVEEGRLGEALLRFGQAALRVGDIRLWSERRVASTFYEDLAETLGMIVGADHELVQDYVVPNVPSGDDYPVDFAIPALHRPLYIFGVLNNDKAKLTTIILQHLKQAGRTFDSLIVPFDIDQIKRADLRRLLNTADLFVDSAQSTDALALKIADRIRI
jgi:hypothetical protein